MKTILAFATLVLSACAGHIEPDLPPTCAVQAELVREQLCPRQAVSVVCGDVAQVNFDPGHCSGPDWVEKQESGNAWCCDGAGIADPSDARE